MLHPFYVSSLEMAVKSEARSCPAETALGEEKDVLFKLSNRKEMVSQGVQIYREFM